MTSYLIIGISERIADDEYIRHQYFWSSFCMKYKFVIGISGRVTKNCSGSECVKLDEENSESSYSLISNKFLEVVNKHVPWKKKVLRGNQSPLVTKEFQKSIYTRSKLKNKIKSFQGKCIGIQETKKHTCVFMREIFEKAIEKHHIKKNKHQ